MHTLSLNKLCVATVDYVRKYKELAVGLQSRCHEQFFMKFCFAH